MSLKAIQRTRELRLTSRILLCYLATVCAPEQVGFEPPYKKREREHFSDQGISSPSVEYLPTLYYDAPSKDIQLTRNVFM